MKKLIVYKPAVKKLLQSLVKRSAFGGCSKFFHKCKPIPDPLSAIAFCAKILSVSVFRNANFGNVGKGIALNGMSIKTVALNRIIGKVHLDSVTDVKQNSVFARLLFFILCYKYVFCPNQGKSDAGAEWLRNLLKDLKRLPIGKYRNQINSRQSTVFMLGRISVGQNITYNGM